MKFFKLLQILALLLIFVACQTPKETQAPPLVDGNIDDFKALNVTPISLMEGVDLYFYQNQHFVWIAYTYPDGSFGTMDMHLESEKLDGPLNLHVSGEVGEWPVNNPELAPKNPESDRWWNMQGWIANEVWPNGMDRSGETPRYKFKNAPSRELQLSKARFGQGEWKIRLNIRAIQTANGQRTSLNFPETEGEYHILKVD